VAAEAASELKTEEGDILVPDRRCKVLTAAATPVGRE